MISLSKYEHLILCTGLFPVIACMILCLFLPDTTALYLCAAIDVAFVLYILLRPSRSHPNLVLLYGCVALILTAIVKGAGGDRIIPAHTLPLVLEIVTFSLALSYFLMPGIYARVLSHFCKKALALNFLAVQILTLFSVTHLFLLVLACLAYTPMTSFLIPFTPPLLYFVCILANYIFLRRISCTDRKIFTLRIAPVCNGKIYVAPRNVRDRSFGKLDIPMEGCFCNGKENADKRAREIKRQYIDRLTVVPPLRFSLKYHSHAGNSFPRTILLYILPFDKENYIHFPRGRFVTPEEIEAEPEKYSSFLQEEVNHLHLVANVWAKFQ